MLNMLLDTLLDELPQLATPLQVARALGLDHRTVRRYVATGRLDGFKFGDDQRAPITPDNQPLQP